ncbi:hypothetical protein K457DRAFT_130472 [Linnemannia elongata AG-77]|uniref:Uncharacterized protein n=1 Tax=Linnemannia elongata AG-77 TaxID=1314771 RepID=A0A197JGK4_9FUNG|nr:hypothetical protein K457DRAFT_130472 [Linnemannia elongata AG-77]
MFLPWTPFVLNIVLAVFQLLLIGAIDAILAIYSRFGGEHANSIRWTRQGGYPEMLKSLYNSWKTIPKSTKVAMVITIFASLAASLLDKGAMYFIIPSVRQGEADPIVAKSSQFSPRGLQRSFTGWSGSIRHGTDIVGAMAKMINDTSNIPEAVIGRVYTPRTFEYEIACDQFDLFVSNASNLLLSNSGCTVAQYSPLAGINIDFNKVRVVNMSKGRWSVSAPATSLSGFMPVQIEESIIVGGRIYALGITEPRVASYIKPGLMSLPTTLTTKCVYPSGEISVLSASTVPFSFSTAQNFRNVSTAVFGEYGDLLQAMEASINNTKATSNSTLFMELKVHGSFIEAVVCSSFENPNPGVISMSCIYNNVNMFIVKQQEINTLIVKARGGRPFPYPPVTSIAMTIEHIVALHNGVPQPVSMSTMKNATYEAAQYLASLGQNFYPDYAEEQLYVLFDTTDPRQGFKIPEWLLISMAATMIACFCLWTMTKALLGVRYTSSLYKVVSMQLSPHIEISAPMLIRSKFEPFEFEDIPVVPVNDLYELDTSKTKSSLKHLH